MFALLVHNQVSSARSGTAARRAHSLGTDPEPRRAVLPEIIRIDLSIHALLAAEHFVLTELMEASQKLQGTLAPELKPINQSLPI